MSVDSASIKATPPFASPSLLERLSSGICCIGGLIFVAAATSAVDADLPIARVVLGCMLIPAALMLYAACFGSRSLKLRMTSFLLSCVIAIAICELSLRTFTIYPIHGQSNLIPDEELGHRLDPDLPDVDGNGFRNPVALSQAEIVTLGDSPTQGLNVASENAWPMQLGRLLKRSVYNYGTGGYGPLHYERLMHQALALKPKLLVVALSPEDDFRDVAEGIASEKTTPWRSMTAGALLRERSAVGSLAWQFMRRAGLDTADVIRVDHPWNPTVIDAETLRSSEAAMNTKDPRIAAAINHTVKVLQLTQAACQEHDCHLLVVFIPSKPRVYRNYIASTSEEIPESLDRTVAREQRVLRIFDDALSASGIEFTDVGSVVADQLQHSRDVYPSWNDNHTLVAGHKAYADAVSIRAAQLLTPTTATTN